MERTPKPAVSGDGFVTVADGTRRWGRFGAAGLLVRHMGEDGYVSYFLARRSEHCHRGGTWAIPGGALDLGEAPLDGALREFTEEIGPAIDRALASGVPALVNVLTDPADVYPRSSALM